MLYILPAFTPDFLNELLDWLAVVAKMEIGKWGIAKSNHAVGGLSANNQHTYVKPLSTKAPFWHPLLNMGSMATDDIDQPSNGGAVADGAYVEAVEQVPIVVVFDGCGGFFSTAVCLIRDPA